MNINETEEQMRDRLNKIFNNMSDDEFKRLLEDAGFEFEEIVEEANEERIKVLSNFELFELLRIKNKKYLELENECILLGKYVGFLKSIIKGGEYFDEHKHHFEWFCRKYQESQSTEEDIQVK